MEILYIPYLAGMDETILKPFAKDVDWELEEIAGSSNRLTLYVPLSEAREVMTEMELLFDSKRYVIAEVVRERSNAEATIIADEAQVELSDRNLKTFSLKAQALAGAMSKAVSGSKWTVGEVFLDSNNYHAEFENISSIQALQFLANQSGGRLDFDSVQRKVNMLPPDKSEPTVTFRYRSNMEDISKSEIQPQATVMYPIGKDGLSIEAVNNKKDYIEDFSWYTNLGIALKDARAKYTKEYVFEDDRYIYPLNLLNDAKKKLAQLSKPQINYNIKASSVDMAKLKLDEQVYVVDEELGVKIKTVVVRMKKCKDASANEVELDYLPASLSVLSKTSLGDSSKSKSETSVFLVKNTQNLTVSSVPSSALSVEITVFTATYFEAGLKLEIECTNAGLLEGYFMMDGNRVGVSIKQSLQVGFNTIGIPFMITQVQEGTKFLDLYLKCSGSAKIEKEKMELFISTAGAYGGVSNTRPDRKVEDEIVLGTGNAIKVNDVVSINTQAGVRRKLSDVFAVTGIALDISDQAGVSVEKNTAIARDKFAKMSNYSASLSVPSQSEVDIFIDSIGYSLKIFKVIKIGDELQVVSTQGLYIFVNEATNKIFSDGEMSLLTKDGYEVKGLSIDYSNKTEALTELEFYRR